MPAQFPSVLVPRGTKKHYLCLVTACKSNQKEVTARLIFKKKTRAFWNVFQWSIFQSGHTSSTRHNLAVFKKNHCTREIVYAHLAVWFWFIRFEKSPISLFFFLFNYAWQRSYVAMQRMSTPCNTIRRNKIKIWCMRIKFVWIRFMDQVFVWIKCYIQNENDTLKWFDFRQNLDTLGHFNEQTQGFVCHPRPPTL